MSVHYKFKSALKYDTITFDGLHISVKDLKRDILHQKQIGKTGDFDLQITNAQTNEVYQDENTLIPKNSSLIVVRVPLTVQQKRAWDRQEGNQQLAGLKNINTNIPPFAENQDPTAQKLAKAVDLSVLDASEDAKILAMMTQSTLDYDPINYARIRGTTQVGEVPASYRCFKCHQAGHWIKDCRLNTNQENQPEIRKSTGIPQSFMVPVEGPSVPGAMITPSGQFAVPSIDQQAYLEGKKPSLPAEDTMEKVTVPEDLICSICHDLLTDTVMIPCCGSSFCDECIRTVLLESENHMCPDCKEIGVSPDTMIPNRYLRKNVDNFLNTTGYQRTHTSRSLAPVVPPPGNSLVQVPLVPSQPIQSLVSRGTRPPEIINLVESRSDTDSPINLHPDKPKSNVRLPLLKTPMPLTNNPNLPPKGKDIGRGLPPDLNRMQYSQRDRSSTPTVDERIPANLPDTSVPPPVATYAITSLAGNPPAFGVPPQAYGGYGRAPLPYPNMGPGPVTGPVSNYPENRRDMRQGYRNSYNRGGRNGRIHGGYREDRNDRHPPERNDRHPPERNDRHPPDRNPPQLGIDDPLSAFEKILREKDMARERRRRKRSISRSPSPRPRSRSRTRSPPPLRKRTSLSVSPPARQRSLTPPVRRSPSPLPRHRTPPRNKPHVRSRTRSRSPRSRSPPPRHRAKRSPRSFTLSRSRSRSFSRTPERSPRDRHFSPKRREDSRFRSPIPGRNSPPQRYGGRNYKESESQYYDERGRTKGRTRGYSRGGRSQDSSYFSNSPARYENRESRYEDRSSRSYQQSSQPRPDSGQSTSTRYSNRRYDNYSDTVPPGTEPMDYDRYRNEYNDTRGTVNVSSERESKRDRELRDAVARDWERTRDREIEQRERERMKEYEEYHRPSFRKSSSPDKVRKRSDERSHERGKENKQHSEGHDSGSTREKPVDQYRDHSHKNVDSFKNVDSYKSTDRERFPVLVDLKKEPSLEKEKKKEDVPTPTKDKKKDKEKKKRKKEEGEKKEKKKKRKEKKEILEKAKAEEKILRVTEAKPIVIAQNVVSKIEDPLYGDIEGTSVDKEVVQNYGKTDPITSEIGNNQATDQNVPGSSESKENVVLAPLPELSKWELDDELPGQEDKLSGDDPSNSSDHKIVTSEVLKRAENAIFQKAINAIRPIDVVKKPVVPEKVPEKDKKEKKDTKEPTVKEEVLEEPITLSPEEGEIPREARKVANSIQITIPSHQPKAPERSVEVAVASKSTDRDVTKIQSRSEKTKLSSVPVIPSSPVRLSAKERLGAKVETDKEETRRVRSTVEQKSRSRSPKRYLERKFNDRDKQRDISPGGRRVVVGSSWSRDKDRDENRRERRVSESSKGIEKRHDKGLERDKDRRKEKNKKSGSPSREAKHRKELKPEKILIQKKDNKTDERLVTVKVSEPQEGSNKKTRKNPKLTSDRKKSILDEANFEPDYDGSEPDSEPEVPGEEKNLLVNVTLNQVSPSKKRSRSPSENKEKKKLKTDNEVIETSDKSLKEKVNDKVKKMETEDSSASDSSSDTSSDSSIDRKKHRKKKKSKKRKKKKAKKRKNSSSDSDSSDLSSSDSDIGKKKKKHKHRKKSSKTKKRKKSKHK